MSLRNFKGGGRARLNSPSAPSSQPRLSRPSGQGDPEAALVDVLHLLDALMEKIWRRLQQLERS